MSNPGSGWHSALMYVDRAQYVDGVLHFVDESLTAGRPVFVAVPASHAAPLRATMNGQAERVRFADMGELGRNPSRIIPAIHAFAEEHSAPVSFVGEPIWAGRSDAEIVEAIRHEALINASGLAARGARILCPYDTGSLRPEVVDGAYRTHRELIDPGGSVEESDRYTDPHEVWADTRTLPPPPSDADNLTVTRDGLSHLRELTRRVAAASELSDRRADNLILAVNELVTNSLRHGGGAAAVAFWADHGSVLCDVQDNGIIRDPLVGCTLPPIDRRGGRGLWLVNQLCDLVQLQSSTHGTRIRVTV